MYIQIQYSLEKCVLLTTDLCVVLEHIEFVFSGL